MNQAEQADLDAFHAWLSDACERGPVPVLTGKNGDMDTVGSAIALASSHPRLMACGIHLGRTAKRVVEELQAPFRRIAGDRTAWPQSMGGIIIVDAAAQAKWVWHYLKAYRCALSTTMQHLTGCWQNTT